MRGATLLRLALLSAALLLLPPLVRRALPGIPAALSAAVALGAGATVRDRWWIFRIHRHELDDALTRSCRMVRATAISTGEGFRVDLAGAALIVRVRTVGRRAFELRFDGPWRLHPKAVLTRSVIAKQFEPPLPRIRIRLRRR